MMRVRSQHQCTSAPMHRYHDAPSIAPTHQGAELKQLTYEADELREQQAAHRQWRRRVRRVLKQHAVAAESAAAAEGGMAASVSVSAPSEAAWLGLGLGLGLAPLSLALTLTLSLTLTLTLTRRAWRRRLAARRRRAAPARRPWRRRRPRRRRLTSPDRRARRSCARRWRARWRHGALPRLGFGPVLGLGFGARTLRLS